MRIVADENIPGLDETFGRFGSILRRKGRAISNADALHADVLLIRSVSRIDEQLLANSKVQFVGSATIGIDHIDTEFLQQAGIRCCHAPGCNADAAAQYTLAMILLAARKAKLDLSSMTAGIVGLGNVGSRLRKLLQIIGIKTVLACDPPLAETGQIGLVDMGEIVNCDLISFHVPLTDVGLYATRHLGNSQFFSTLKPGALLVNSSRGEIFEAKALNHWLNSGKGMAALDVWPGEPVIDAALLDKVTVATPHVAGYSLEGKLNGTRMLFRQFLDWQQLQYTEPLAPHPPPTENFAISPSESLEQVILTACPVEADEQTLRSCLHARGQIAAAEFDALRKNYRNRRDFAGKMLPKNCPEALFGALKALGFAQSSH